jgi:hypothetical protein
MEFLGVYPPRGIGRHSAPPQKGNKNSACDEPFDFSASAVDVLRNNIHYRPSGFLPSPFIS